MLQCQSTLHRRSGHQDLNTKTLAARWHMTKSTKALPTAAVFRELSATKRSTLRHCSAVITGSLER